MVQNEECQELLMLDVVRIDIMPIGALKVGVPFSVQNQTHAGVTMADDSALTDVGLYTDSLLSLNLTGDATADAEMGEGVNLNVSEKLELAGMVRTHTLQVPVEADFQRVRDKENALQQTEFHLVLTTYDGTRYLVYALPGTCSFSIDEQMGGSAQMNVKVVVKSMSGAIRIDE